LRGAAARVDFARCNRIDRAASADASPMMKLAPESKKRVASGARTCLFSVRAAIMPRSKRSIAQHPERSTLYLINNARTRARVYTLPVDLCNE